MMFCVPVPTLVEISHCIVRLWAFCQNDDEAFLQQCQHVAEIACAKNLQSASLYLFLCHN